MNNANLSRIRNALAAAAALLDSPLVRPFAYHNGGKDVAADITAALEGLGSESLPEGLGSESLPKWEGFPISAYYAPTEASILAHYEMLVQLAIAAETAERMRQGRYVIGQTSEIEHSVRNGPLAVSRPMMKLGALIAVEILTGRHPETPNPLLLKEREVSNRLAAAYDVPVPFPVAPAGQPHGGPDAMSPPRTAPGPGYLEASIG